ncbi:hypothetical protein JCM8097_001963 [Rhodosporidiobolus ruineniae]
MADFLYNAGPPPPRSPFGNRPNPPSPGLRFTPPSQARQLPSPNYPQPGYDQPYPSPQHPHYTHQQPYASPPQPGRLPSSPHLRSPEPGFEPQTITCSSCGEAVPLDELGEHICRPRQDRGLRVDVQAAGPGRDAQYGGQGGYGGSMSARSPMFGGRLEATPPHTPGSAHSIPLRSASPGADQLSRSVGSTTSSASASSSRLPFFEKYQKQYGASGSNGGNMAGVGAGMGMPRSGTMDNLASTARGGSPSPRLTPAGLPYAPIRSPTSPLPTSSSAPNLGIPAFARQDSLPIHYQQRQPSPGPPSHSSRSDSRDTDFPPDLTQTHRRQETPESSVLSSSPPRSRKASIPDRGPSPRPPPAEPLPPAPLPVRKTSLASSASSDYLAYDRREGVKPSQSTPANLSSYAAPPRPGVPPRKDSAAELDACMEDLRLVADGRTGTPPPQSRSRNGDSSRRDSYGRPRGGVQDDPLATPKATTPARMPTSRSTPALSGGERLPPPVGSASLTPSGSVPSLSSSSSTSSSRPSPSSIPSSPSQSCTTCRRPLPSRSDITLSGDGQPFCRPCFADRFLPKCRKCRRAIEKGAVTSSDGKIEGKYHRECFACFDCGEKFANGEFYVFEGKPYCQLHYHALNGSLCANRDCGKPIEGPCVSLVGEENGGGGRYHPPCFLCSDPTCRVPLLEHHFVVDRLPYCEMHSAGPVRRRQPRAGGGEDAQTRAKKRMTVITR